MALIPPTYLDRPDVAKAKQIVCAILRASGGTFRGKTRLNKTFWWAHVYHHKNHVGLLSKYPIARLPEGPCIDAADQILFELESDGSIVASIEPKGPYLEDVYTLGYQAKIDLSQDEIEAINKAVEWAGTKTAVYISQESHRLSRGWQEGRDGQIIDIALDSISDAESAQFADTVNDVISQVEQARPLIDRIFGVGHSSQAT